MSAPVVLDTNIVLDLYVFNDLAAQPVRDGLLNTSLRWLATPAMRDELARVLTYPHIAVRLGFYQREAAQVLQSFDNHAHMVATPPKASVTCKDPDDQKFIDLAVAHKALLLSKDHAVLSMRKRLLALAVTAQAAMNSVANSSRHSPDSSNF
jgi:putative PIN family toxin of toxin-antitoxin system